MSQIEKLDMVMRSALESLAVELAASSWKGQREREVVSLFCFGHLLRCCREDGILYDPTQITIEVAVPQIDGQRLLTGKDGSKAQVCKDIVIWQRPRMTCWDEQGKATVRPLSVIEWKHNQNSISAYDMRWLHEFSSQTPGFVGYAVCTSRPARGFTLSCTRVFLGESTDKWLHIS